jgi:transketolase
MTERSQFMARQARRSALAMVHRAKSAHIGSSLSVIDILAALYGNVARIGPELLDDPDRDIVVVSKGHAAAGAYAVLGAAGILDEEVLRTYSTDGAPLGGHVTSAGVPGVELSTGSLGHGLPYGLGMALAAKRRNSEQRAFIVMSDGECDEGTTWEAAMLAAHHGLDNLVVAIDRNGLQSLASTEDTLRLEPFADKWRAFGWEVFEIDGHDHDALIEAFTAPVSGKPRVVIAKTIKGKGVSFMENSVVWHYRPPSDEQLALALAELES